MSSVSKIRDTEALSRENVEYAGHRQPGAAFSYRGHISFAKNCPLDQIIQTISKGNPFAIACEKSKRKNHILSGG